MATLTRQSIARTGLNPTYAAATAATGDKFTNTGKECLHIQNGSGGTVVATITTPATLDGQAVADRTVSIPAGEKRFIGPFPKSMFNDSNDEVTVTCDVVTSVTLACLVLTPEASLGSNF